MLTVSLRTAKQKEAESKQAPVSITLCPSICLPEMSLPFPKTTSGRISTGALSSRTGPLPIGLMQGHACSVFISVSYRHAKLLGYTTLLLSLTYYGFFDDALLLWKTSYPPKSVK